MRSIQGFSLITSYEKRFEMDKRDLSRLMFMSLRHKPSDIGISLDHEGYCDLDSFLLGVRKRANLSGATIADIEAIVRTDNKQRYKIDNGQIKANYGHSCLRVTYPAVTPPEILIHGTSMANWQKIKSDGLRPMTRKYTHMSESVDFAILAGNRKIKDSSLVLIQVRTLEAHADGVIFYLADNGVWLADYVPAKYLFI
jgi:putative RNA 2'-phosphotransferase